MPVQYNLKSFLRKVNKELLMRYLTAHGIGPSIDWNDVTTHKIDPVFDAIVYAPEEIHMGIDRDFREVWEMDSEGARATIIGEGAFHDLNMAHDLRDMENHLDAAFWTFMEYQEVFDIAYQFNYSDNLPNRSWRKRIDIPGEAPAVDEESKERLGKAISGYYRTKEGRGQAQSAVDHYKRGDRLYWFVYPQDYAVTAMEYDENNQFQTRTIRPAFEVIFVFDPTFRTLDTYVKAKRKTVEKLQDIWGQVILGTELGTPTYPGSVFKLDHLKRKGFPFTVNPASGIEDVRVRKLRFKLPGAGNQRLTLEADVRENRDAVYDLLDRIIAGGKIPLDHMCLSNVALRFAFRADRRKKGKVLTCNISYPDGCDLGHDSKDEIARDHLAKWGIDVSEHVIPDTEAN